jgi:hypothetical protein
MASTTTRRPLLIAAALAIALGAGLYFSGVWPGASAQIVREPVSQPLGAATRANVTIGMAAGQLRLGALDQPSALVAGEISYPNQNRVTREFAVHDGLATFSLHEQDSQANSLIKYSNEDAIWDLRLNPTTPTYLTVVTGIGESTVDLSQLHITKLDLETGVGNTTLTLPGQGQVQAHIQADVGNSIIHIPAGVAVHLEVSGGMGSVDFPDTYRPQDKAYVSPGYATAANRVDLTVNRSVGNLTIKQSGE